jgi:hypothetical protein
MATDPRWHEAQLVESGGEQETPEGDSDCEVVMG